MGKADELKKLEKEIAAKREESLAQQRQLLEQKRRAEADIDKVKEKMKQLLDIVVTNIKSTIQKGYNPITSLEADLFTPKKRLFKPQKKGWWSGDLAKILEEDRLEEFIQMLKQEGFKVEQTTKTRKKYEIHDSGEDYESRERIGNSTTITLKISI